VNRDVSSVRGRTRNARAAAENVETNWTMTKADAVNAPNRFLLHDRGSSREPIQAVLMRPCDRPRFWVVRYGTSILFPKETEAGSTVDGGDYILSVRDTTERGLSPVRRTLKT
jgi:hypothetical protein